MLSIGQIAPDFTLPDKDGHPVSLSSFRGKPVILYFYPKDSTPGCTRQACAFAANYAGFESRGTVVIGISRDSQASHARFAEKNALPFLLLSDPERATIEPYGVWQEKKMAGKSGMGIVRTTFLIDEEGRVEAILPKVKPDDNAEEMLRLLDARKKGA